MIIFSTFIECVRRRLVLTLKNVKLIKYDNCYQHVEITLRRCRDAQIDWLIHIDDDELLLPRGSPMRSLLASVESEGCGRIHFENFEALLPNGGCDNPFECCTSFVRCAAGGCMSYANGKAGARARTARWGGCHHFDGDEPCLDVPPAQLCVLHYESLDVDRWMMKYGTLADMTADRLRQIPFGFYHASVEAAKLCRGAPCAVTCLRGAGRGMIAECRTVPGGGVARIGPSARCGRAVGADIVLMRPMSEAAFDDEGGAS